MLWKSATSESAAFQRTDPSRQSEEAGQQLCQAGKVREIRHNAKKEAQLKRWKVARGKLGLQRVSHAHGNRHAGKSACGVSSRPAGQADLAAIWSDLPS